MIVLFLVTYLHPLRVHYIMNVAFLHRCLQLDPSNLTALMALAVSYTNESRQQEVSTNSQQTLESANTVHAILRSV